MIKTSRGNKKLPKDTLIFNLPARMTCPGRTEFCEKKCYALKAERLYKAVLPARQGNFEISRSAEFVRLMTDSINNQLKHIKRVRVHESGDFYNQDYLDKWFEIASAFPGLTFYAYTKSFHLNFVRKPSNFVLIASFDEATNPAMLANYHLRSQYFDNTFTIVKKNEEATCIQDCTVCDKCWNSKSNNLTVNVH